MSRVCWWMVLVLLVFLVPAAVEGWGRRRRSPPPPSCPTSVCSVTPWSTWTTCPTPCAIFRVQSRVRKVTASSACISKCYSYFPTYQSRYCNQACFNGGSRNAEGCSCRPGYTGLCCEQVPGGWSPWSQWSGCGVTCGGGTERRSRSCTNPPPMHGGADCGPLTSETRACNPDPCSVPGGWSPWSRWSGCGVTCGGGTEQRSRSCTNPPPMHGGADCGPLSSETRVCNPNPCPVPGGWSPWSRWSGCAVTCGGGTEQRSRSCTNPPPMHGGADCGPLSSETRVCNPDPCPVPGGWSAWGLWSACSVSCRGGVEQRTRSCTNPPPMFGGAGCGPLNSETKQCNPQPCPSDGVTVTCTTHFIQVDLLKSMYSYLDPSTMHLSDSTCKADAVNSTHVTFIVPLESCGTTHTTEGDKIIYSNEVSGAVPVNTQISRDYDNDFPFKCKYTAAAVLDAGSFSPKRKKVLSADDSFGNYTFLINMYKSKQYKTAYTPDEFPVSIILGDRLFFQVEVTSKNTQLILFIDYCKATPGQERNNKIYHPIISNGCGNDNTLQYTYKRQASQQFSFEAFRFVDYDSDVYIHCAVEVCHKDTKKSRCSIGCAERRRRDEDYTDEQDDGVDGRGTLVLGPLIFIQVEEESSPPSNEISIWVGSVCGVLGLTIICILVITFYWMRIRGEGNRNSSGDASPDPLVPGDRVIALRTVNNPFLRYPHMKPTGI